MDPINSLHRELNRHLPWHQARLRLIAPAVVALIQVRSANLTAIALAFNTPVQGASVYKRLQRFLRHYQLDFDPWARLITRGLDLGERWRLCLDRTPGQFGRYTINILVLGVAYRGVTVPLFWRLLDKKGNSSTDERMALIERFLRVFSVERIPCLTADREFRGQAWLRFLDRQGILFRLRLPNNTRTTHKHGHLRLPVQRLFALRVRETRGLSRPRLIWGMPVYLACIRLDNEQAIIATHQAPETALPDDLQRWSIETLFGCLKTRGFNLEDTHLRDHERIERLLALWVLAFSGCLKTGIWKHGHKPSRIKKHQRPAKSLFR